MLPILFALALNCYSMFPSAGHTFSLGTIASEIDFAHTRQEEASDEAAANQDVKSTILILGDSLSEGYGIDIDKTYPALLQDQIDELELPYRIINRSRSGDTTAGGLSRLRLILEKEDVDILLIALGGNDGLRGLQPEGIRKNLKAIITLCRNKSPDAEIMLLGLRTPPSMGIQYATTFDSIFKKVAAEEDVHLLPFLLEGVAGNPRFNLPDRIHPNEKGHEIIFENVWTVLAPLLQDAE